MLKNSIVVTISIVSHNQSDLIELLLADLSEFGCNISLIITINSGIVPNIDVNKFNNVKFIQNTSPLGFGHNHNNAFLSCNTDVFIVCNPDIRVNKDNLYKILFEYNDLTQKSVWGPILLEHGEQAENGRNFPTFLNMIYRVMNLESPLLHDNNSGIIKVDWIGGMFMVFSKYNYSLVSGFDQDKYFMYLEDVDICKRLAINLISVSLNTETTVNHDAQRNSRKNIKHFYWHLTSLIKFLFLSK